MRRYGPETCALVALALVTASSAPLAAAEGAALFVAQCGVCHVLKSKDGARQGPHLEGLMGRKAGAVDGFPYSDGLKAAGFAWSPERLDAWLADPQAVIGDSYMAYKQPDASVRAKLIAYLQAETGE